MGTMFWIFTHAYRLWQSGPKLIYLNIESQLTGWRPHFGCKGHCCSLHFTAVTTLCVVSCLYCQCNSQERRIFWLFSITDLMKWVKHFKVINDEQINIYSAGLICLQHLVSFVWVRAFTDQHVLTSNSSNTAVNIILWVKLTPFSLKAYITYAMLGKCIYIARVRWNSKCFTETSKCIKNCI